MSAQQVQLREGLKTRVQSLLTLPDDTVVESRRIPRVSADDLEDLHLIFFLLDLDSEVTTRGFDAAEFTIGLAIQQKVSGDDTTPVDNLVEFVETVKTLWRSTGTLREEVITNCIFKTLVQSEIFDFQHLLKYGVFTAILELTYTTEID